jgi:dienelactone hydrolase
MYRLLAQGIAVVVTDYVGLGATDRLHTYVNRVDEGHAVLDAARAARALPRTSLTPRSPVGLFGYSQGGGAVASAAELQPSYAPDLPLRATYAGAPPANLDDVTAAIDGSELTAALGWSVNGFAQSEPALRPLLDKYLNAAGRAALKDVATMCVGEALTAYAGKRSSAWTTTGSSISDIIRTEPVLRRFVDQQRIGRHRPAGAVLVITSVSDNLVAHPQARTLAVDWCRLGAKVEYRPIFLPKLDSPLVNHFAPVIGAQDTALTWISQRLSGTPAVSNCATMTWQP